MKVTSGYQDGKLTLYLQGELDHHEASAALRRIGRTLDDYLPQDCVIDMDGLTFMDSSGIALILKISRLKVIDASGIDRMIKISTAAKQ